MVGQQSDSLTSNEMYRVGKEDLDAGNNTGRLGTKRARRLERKNEQDGFEWWAHETRVVIGARIGKQLHTLSYQMPAASYQISDHSDAGFIR